MSNKVEVKLKTVLLVEDDSVDAMTVSKAMNDLKVLNELVHCSTAEKALEYLKSGNHDTVCVILLDLNLPGMNGIDLLKIVKADKKLMNIPVVMLAASQEEKNIVETFHLGVAGYIFKPIDSKKLEDFEPMRLYLMRGRDTVPEPPPTSRRTLFCLFLLTQLIVANISYNLWAKQREAPIQDILTAHVIYDLWTQKVMVTKTGTVVGILYNEKGPCALINHMLAYEGDTLKGVKIVKIDRSQVEFEKNGQRWTQHMLDEPNPAWQTPTSMFW